MKKLTKTELQVRNREIQDRLAELNDKAYKENRNLTDEEKREWDNLSREKSLNSGALRDMADNADLAKMRENENKNEKFRELLQDHGQKREILLYPATLGSTSNITASGAINLTVHDVIPTLNEGLGLPPSLRIVTGVTGNEVWPVNTDDVEMEEVGEVAQLNDQVLNFQNITPVQHRVGLKVPVSNMAIDNAAFDLMSFVQTKFTLALKKYLAKKIYSQANWNGNKGPFAGLSKKGDIDLANNPFQALLQAVAAFTEEGYNEENVCLVLSPTTEAMLKATPKQTNAAAGFIIENGLCAGYPYVTSHYINTTLNGSNQLVPTSDKYIGIGYFEWFALQQHGDVRMVVDPITLADKNVTRVVLNTAWSSTDLSKYINGGNPTTVDDSTVYPTQAFALYKVVEPASSAVIGD